MFEVEREPLYSEITEFGEKKEDYALTGNGDDAINKYVYQGGVYLVKHENKSVSPLKNRPYFL